MGSLFDMVKGTMNNPNRVLQFFDNGGRTTDRYTIMIGKEVYAMSDNPLSSQGFNAYAGNIGTSIPSPGHRNVGKRIKWVDLPNEVQEAVRRRARSP